MTLQVGDRIPIGGSGNVKKSEVLAGKTYSSDEGTDLVGTMPNRGKMNILIDLGEYKDLIGKQTVANISNGYYSGGEIELERVPDDTSNSPGSKIIKIGDKKEGYYGLVKANELITGDDLALMVGVSAGFIMNSSTFWHKFSWQGKTLFVSQQRIANRISWDYLNHYNLVYGDKVVDIKGVKYKIRLLKGALTDPAKYDNDDRGAKGSEWNRLILPLLKDIKDKNWYYPNFVESDLKDWGTYINLNDASLGNQSSPKHTWCQETSINDTSKAILRGGVSAEVSIARSKDDSGQFIYGWRPVLEVVE